MSAECLISQAVTERKHYFANLSFKFSRRLQEHLTGLFVQQVPHQY